MWSLFAQVWVLCAIAFLAGAAVTWLAFVRPLRKTRGTHPTHRAEPGTHVAGRPDDAGETADAAERADPPPPVDPALAALDADVTRRPEGAGTAAAEALDRLSRQPADRTENDPGDRTA
ncbi:hypothetical protein [Pseudonocardia nigra]|uniref:hypothetical protein n=1 Tax=Pseudonocardia nigra TaxID=1921578 RepID=UPI001C5D285B|nr:hypothetical protein [Pseudonocardia nigra]